MKRILILLLFGFCLIFSAKAQVKIGDNPQNIDAASVLELESTDKVLVITRVNTTQMNAISPLQGALVFNTDVQSVHYYDGTQWVNIGGGGGTGGILTADPIVNDVSSIVITPTANGDNLEVAQNSIGTLQIANGGVNGTDDILDNSIGPNKIQDQSVTQEKLSENSVGAFALDNDNIGVSAFNNDVGYITSANIVSTDAGNALQIGTDNGAFYDELPLINAIQDNADALALDNDQSPSNEIQNLTLNGSEIGLTDTAGTIDIGPLLSSGGNPNDELITNAILIGTDLEITEAGTVFTVPLGSLSGGGDPTDELTDISFNTTTNILTLSNSATVPGGTVDLSSLAGGGGSQTLDAVLTTGNDGGASLIRNILDPLLPQDAATRAYVDATVASGGSLADGTILIGDTTNAAQQLFVSGDATLANDGQLTIATDAIDTGKILNATVLAEDFNQMGATNGQVLKWDDATTSWITAADDTGTAALNNGDIYIGDAANAPQGVTMSGDATIDNTGALTIEDDAITLNKIDQNGATADGDIIQWNNVTGEWEVGVNASHTGTANNIFFAGSDGKPTDTGGNANLSDNGGLLWDPSKRFSSGALFLGYKANGNSGGSSMFGDFSKLAVAERINGTLVFPIQVVNEGNAAGTSTGILFTNNANGFAGGAGLVLERVGPAGQGDFHFLASAAGATAVPALADKVLTVENDGDVVLTGDIIAKNGAGALNQVLTTTAAGTEWAAPTGGGLNISGDIPNSITTGTDGGILYADGDSDDTNEIELPTGGASGNVLSTNGAGVYNWVANTAGTVTTDASISGDGGATPLSIAAVQGSFLGGPGVIVPNTIGTGDIGANAITSSELDALSVGTSELKNAEVTVEKITPSANDGEVLTTVGGVVAWSPAGGSSMLAGDVTGPAGSNVIAPNAVTSSKIADLSITSNKIDTGAVGDLAIGTGAVRTDEILDGSIINADINGGAAIDGSKINPTFTNQIIAQAGLSTQADIFMNGFMHIPDYVFQKYYIGNSELDESYSFQTLEEVEYFVKKHHHLPGIKSAKQVEEEGAWNLSKSNLQNLEKIEELFLHTIEQEHKINKLESDNQNLTDELKALQKDILEIKALLKQQ